MSTLPAGQATAADRIEEPRLRRRDLRSKAGRIDVLNTTEIPVVPSPSAPMSGPVPMLEPDPEGGARLPVSVLPVQRPEAPTTSSRPIPVGRPIRWDEVPRTPTAPVLRPVPTQSAAVAAESMPSPARSVPRASPWSPVGAALAPVPTQVGVFAPTSTAPGEPHVVTASALPGWGGVPAFPIPGTPRERQHRGRSVLASVLGAGVAVAAAVAALQYFELVDLLGLIGW